jgi:6-pyruvoyl tetrahydropterin synthase/QueD family protein
MYKVIVEKEYLSFSIAHFISFAGKCERMHGHNYAVSVELEGGLTGDRYVLDFVVLKGIVRQICDALDHHFLLPQRSQCLDIKEAGGEWEIRFGSRRYVLPAEDVLPLPVDNITAERLAEYICGQLIAALQAHDVDGLKNLTSVTVGVEESPGQTAFYQHRLSQAAP